MGRSNRRLLLIPMQLKLRAMRSLEIRAVCTVAMLLFVAQGADEWMSMPGGRHYHRDCIHHVNENDHIDLADLSPCIHQPRPRLGSSRNHESPLTRDLHYYSDWSAYAQSTHTQGFGGMVSEWEVPAKPTSRGPAPPLISSSIYLFNGLEDGGGHHGNASLILQPVLQFGKSGCLLNPLKFGDWYLTSYVVDGNGRAHCGKNIGPLTPGERVRGVMTLHDAASNTWNVQSIRLKTGEVSSYSVKLGVKMIDAAYLTLEGMVIYNCKAYPASDSVTYSNNTMLDRDGKIVHAPWVDMIRHSECKQDVHVDVHGSVEISWNSTA